MLLPLGFNCHILFTQQSICPGVALSKLLTGAQLPDKYEFTEFNAIARVRLSSHALFLGMIGMKRRVALGKDRLTDKQTDRQTDRQIDKQTDTQIDAHTDRQTKRDHTEIEMETNRKERQMGR